MQFKEILKKFSKQDLKNEIHDYTDLLTISEIKQLKVFNKLEEFNMVYEKLQNKNSNFKKNDALWAIYNDLKLKFELEKDISSLGVIFERQSEILINDKKYEQALETYLTALYCLLFHYEISSKEVNIIDRHFNIKRRGKLIELMKKSVYDKSMLKEEFNIIIKNNIPSFYIEKKANFIIKNILMRI